MTLVLSILSASFAGFCVWVTVGLLYTPEGRPIYGHVSFDLPIQKGFLRRLGKQSRAMEAAAQADDEVGDDEE
jgi:hypothetical protein